MIINLCFDSNMALNIIKKYPNEEVLDITGVLYQKEIKNNLILSRKIDNNGDIERRALNRYVETIGKLSEHKINRKQSIRDININKISFFWLTPIALKHDSYRWGQVFFFLILLLEEKNSLFKKNLIIILHKSTGKAISSIKNSIENCISNVSITFIKTGTINTSFFSLTKKLVKESCFYFKFKLKHHKNKEYKKILNTNFFITKNFKAVNLNNSDFDIGWKKTIIEENGGNSFNIPYVSSFCILPNFSNNNFLKTYLDSAPTVSQFLLLHFSLFFSFFNIRIKIRNNFLYKSVSFHKSLLIGEFMESINNIDLLINNIWLNNFSKKTTSCNYYFSDEMSLTGRVISASIYKGGANKTIGVQHGLISDNHTIYRITDNEQTGQKTVPLPDKLFIWDNIFKKRLLLNSDIIKKRVEIINNEQYDHLRREVQSQKKYQYKKTKNILWCTTLPEHFIFEANILKNINSKEYNIMVRLHPVGHITENFIKEILSNKLSYTISKNNLTSDFIFADIVITNPFSTIFYDAINVGIPVIRILHFSTYIDFKEDFKGKLFDVFNYKQLQKILENDGIYNFNIKN